VNQRLDIDTTNELVDSYEALRNEYEYLRRVATPFLSWQCGFILHNELTNLLLFHHRYLVVVGADTASLAKGCY